MKLQTLALTALISSLVFATLDTSAKGPSVQALLGAVRYDDLTIENGSGNTAGAVDIPTMPQFGGAWSTAPKGNKLQFGLECSFLLSFDYGSQSYNPTMTSRVDVDYYIWMFDIAGGVYANMFLGKAEKIRLYAAGGPIMMPSIYGSKSYQNNTIVNDSYYRNDEISFSYGLYGRAGIEFRVHEAGMLGLGVRGTWLDTDLSDIDTLTSIAAFVSFTAML